MINNQENMIKLKMLDAFEAQMNYIFLKYNNYELNYGETVNYLNRYLYLLNISRIDLKNIGNENNSLNIIKNTKDINFWFPGWFADDYGHGCQVEFQNRKISMNILCNGDGVFRFNFRGVDFKNLENQRVPIYVNYENIVINKNKLIYIPQLTWHDEPFDHSRMCDNNEIIDINIECKTIMDYFPQLKNFFKNIQDSSELNKEFLNILQFIKYEKIMIEQGTDQKVYYQLDNEKYKFFSTMDEKLMINHLNNKIHYLEDEFKEYKDNTDKIINAHYDLLNTLFIYCDFKTKGLLKYNHILNQELLNFIVNICNKYNLKYWLDYGILLGAMRHEGFIPWDDDIDIGMIREDYDILVDKIKGEIDNNGLSDLLKISINVNFYKHLPALQLLYYCEEVSDTIIAGIDILPYDFIDDITNCDLNTYLNVRNSVINNNRNGMPIQEAVKEYFDKFNISYGAKEYIISGIEGPRGVVRGVENFIFETKDILPLKKAKFENTEYYIPNNPDKFLTMTYGDYMNLSQAPYNHQGRFDNLRKIENGKEIFKKNIIKLKKINENYQK